MSDQAPSDAMHGGASASSHNNPGVQGGSSASEAASARQHHALKFLVGNSPAPRNISAVDQDIAAWLLMNSDLFPNQARQNSAAANAATEDDEAMSAAMLTPTLGSSPLAASAPPATLAAQSIDGNSVTSFGSTTGGVTTVATAMGVPAVKTEGDSSAAGGSTKGESISDKRRRRLEKNRVIARNCRKRKRERMQELEEQVKALSSANQQLRLRLKRGNDIRRKEDKRVQELARIQDMTRTGASEAEVAKAIIAYKDLFADYGKDRQAAVMYHLEQLRMLLLPTQVTKMCMWSLHQDDEFYDEEKNQTSWGGGIWNILCKELDITPQQKRSLMGLRAGIKAQRNRLRASLRMLNDLETHVKAGVDSLESEMLQLMKCVTPMQQARFLVWIENNQACMHMLNNLWKAESSEPTPATAPPTGAAHVSSGLPGSSTAVPAPAAMPGTPVAAPAAGVTTAGIAAPAVAGMPNGQATAAAAAGGGGAAGAAGGLHITPPAAVPPSASGVGTPGALPYGVMGNPAGMPMMPWMAPQFGMAGAMNPAMWGMGYPGSPVPAMQHLAAAQAQAHAAAQARAAHARAHTQPSPHAPAAGGTAVGSGGGAGQSGVGASSDGAGGAGGGGGTAPATGGSVVPAAALPRPAGVSGAAASGGGAGAAAAAVAQPVAS